MTIDSKYLLKNGVVNLNYQIDHTQYQILKIISYIFLKKQNENVNNPSVRIYVNKIENKITFKIKNA